MYSGSHHNRNRYGIFFCLALLSVWFLSGSCVTTSGLVSDEDLKKPYRQLATYKFNPTETPAARILKTIPDATLKYIRELDNRPYAQYKLNRTERAQLVRSIASMPAMHRRVFQQRVVGIFFVEDFLTNGMTDFIYHDGQFYCFLILDRNVLNQSMTEILTNRERTAIRFPEQGSHPSPVYDVRIEVSGKQAGLDYILVHELTHAVDLVNRVTPYLEPSLRKLQAKQPRKISERFTDSIWDTYNQPRSAFDFEGRSRLAFFGFRNGPLLDASEIPAIYNAWSQSGFISTYGSTIWAEDLAELVSYYHISHKRGLRYQVLILKNGKVMQRYRPMEHYAVQKRLVGMEVFYK